MKKISSHILVSFLIPCLCLFSSFIFAAVPTYKIVDLGLQESDFSEAVAVNDNGQVAGIFYFLGNKYYFLWDAERGIQLLDLPVTAEIKVLNNVGQIAGQYGDYNDRQGFFWDPVQGFIDLGTLGGKGTSVEDMNDHGQIVGCSRTGRTCSVHKNNFETHAYLWQNGNMIDLGTLDGDMGLYGDLSVASSINNAGLIVGRSTYGMVHKGKLMQSPFKGVIWRDGVIEPLAPEFEGCLIPLCINDNGLVTSQNFDKSGSLKELCVFDLSSRKTWQICGSAWPSKINEKGNMLDKHYIYFFDKQTISYQMQPKKYFNEIASFPWKELIKVSDFNSNNWIVGSAKNIYGEQHAVLMVPIN